ncbi:MAG: hypothetical protein V4677_11830 [Bacteroidota bacterium]
MKTLSFILATSLIITSGKAQDLITRNDSSIIKATILEINPREIKYKLFNYPDGPLISNNKEDIAYIIFSNGAIDRFTKSQPKPVPVTNYNPNRYNMDVVPVSVYSAEVKNKKCEKLYTRKNYIGYNYISFLNSAIGFNYMRDIKKANLIINVPFAFGVGSPSITNSLYKGVFLNGDNTATYDRMRYQVGLNILFAPSMTREVNFLMGPSFNYSDYKMSVETKYTTPGAVKNNDATFNNNFNLKREHYGVNIGFLARFSERVNMNMLITFGYKKDTYDQKDPFGIDYMNSVSMYQNHIKQDNVMPYVNFAWSVGYRF